MDLASELMVSFFAVSAIYRFSKDSPSFSAISLRNFCSESCCLMAAFAIIYYVFFPYWFSPSLTAGRVSKYCVKFAPSHGVMACHLFFVVGIVLGPHTISAIVAFFQLVAVNGTMRVRIAPTWPFMQVAVVVLDVAVFVVVVVVSDSILVQRCL